MTKEEFSQAVVIYKAIADLITKENKSEDYTELRDLSNKLLDSFHNFVIVKYFPEKKKKK